MKYDKVVRCALVALGLGIGLGACSSKDTGAAWPEKPVRMVVPFPAGGSTDAVARFIAQRLGEKLGQSFVVDNRPGAGGNIGTDQVAKAEPDGYTITLSTSGPLANNKYLYKAMPYDPQKDLAPIALVSKIPLVVVANAQNPAGSLKAFVEAAKAPGAKYAIGNPGNGTIGHLAYELFRKNSGAPFVGVPYKGDNPALTDLLGNQIQGIVAPITAFIPHIKAGKLKGLAVMSNERFPGTPDVPTAKEQGVDTEALVWFAIAGPAGMPRPIVDKLNREINAILRTDEGKATLEQIGGIVGGGSPEDLGSLVLAESEKWKSIIEEANIRLD